MSTEKQTPAITEINTELLKRSRGLLDGFTQNPKGDSNISINLEFWNYASLGHNIESLLNAMSISCEPENSLDVDDIQNVALITKQLVNKIPLDFLDRLLIKDDYNQENFKNIENL
ncbi:hypothetical protein [Tenacibaculum finnmarkense]|uniref:hypothetical protein n=1 Tax=Tenacibaculum finnmarkense TaxID=2781243 RepID=UPI001EFBB51D|nr:hypothetical protein [Tenacibaculum finnmarkense]MCG8763875.1 hypothetical protein [Tenacibaculum finnmarkense]MCG8776544.1 hypothetical protein [Tenacibaculum finnmarkense]MCG8901414.1 hypothetical protein [Tenacibaculum finnmarkense]